VQNFKPVGPSISEISRSEKKTSGLKLKSASQAIAFGRTKNAQICEHHQCPPTLLMMQLSSENDHNSISNKILQYALQKPSIPDYISLVFS